MVKVCDSIMGSGKSSAAINYMLAHKDTDKFIYVTPFLDETERIRDACAVMNFQTPSSDVAKYDYKKREHLKALAEEGANISTTHALLSCCDNSVADIIGSQNYIIIIDEALEVFDNINIKTSDLEMLCACGMIQAEKEDAHPNLTYYEVSGDNEYGGGMFSRLFTYSENKRLIRMSDNSSMFCGWEFNPHLLTVAKDVLILTYLFEHTAMRCLMDMNNIKYSRIFVEKNEEKGYIFVNYPTKMPKYVAKLSNLIHICDDSKLNDVGVQRNALSCNWMGRQSKQPKGGELDRLRRNLNTFFKLRCSNISADGRMWSSYKLNKDNFIGKGFAKSFVSFNCRAVNNLRQKQALAYLVNIYINPNLKKYLAEYGVTISDDGYALQTMIQWIWRSAIRDGKEIWIYIPSSRMRNILKQWISGVTKAYEDSDNNY